VKGSTADILVGGIASVELLEVAAAVAAGQAAMAASVEPSFRGQEEQELGP